MPEESDLPPPPGKPRRHTGSAFAGETTGGQGAEANEANTQPRGSWDESTRGADSVVDPAAGRSSESREIIDDFEILSKLGQGGMGWVYRARQMSLDRQVALKILPSYLDQDPTFVARFVREARVAGNLQHPNLVKVYTSGVAEGTHTHFIAMELVEGETLADWVKRGALPPLDALRITLDIARALEHGWRTAHLIHRDIKPGNIFLSHDGRVKLGDLGLAKTMDGETSTGLTQTGKAMGTPHYISPEQARGDKDIDFRADIYSLGCTLFQMLTGQTPYSGGDAVAIFHHHIHSPPPAILKVMPGLPVPLARLVAKMLKKQRRERFGSYEELIAAIESVQVQIDPAAMATIRAATASEALPGGPTGSGGLQPPGAGGSEGEATPRGGGFQPPRALAKRPSLKLYAGIAAAVLVLGLAGYLFWPKETLTKAQIYAHDHAAELAVKAKAQAEAKAIAAALDGATKDAPFENTLGMKFVPVPIVGGPTSGRRVLFSIWDTRVQDYEAFAKETKREWPKLDFEQGPTHPAAGVTWDDAQAFCQWLTARERLAAKLPAEWRYRLPSDHEWSCAVGIGAREDAAKLPSEKNNNINDVFPWGITWPPPDNAGNYWSEELRPAIAAGKYPWIKGELTGRRDGYTNTSPVGSFPANVHGLYDMGGDVRQWCEDWLDKDQKHRVLRGASWLSYDRYYLLSSNRDHDVPGDRNDRDGFRCVLAPETEGRAPAAAPVVGADTAAAGNQESAYPQPVQWIDVTENVRSDGLKDGSLAMDGEWIALPSGKKDAWHTLTARSFRNVAVRIVFSKAAHIFLRKPREHGRQYHGEVHGEQAGLGSSIALEDDSTSPKTSTVLARGPDLPGAADSAHELVFAVQGDLLMLWLDGKELAKSQDATLQTGLVQIALFNRGRVKKIEYGELPDASIAHASGAPVAATKETPFENTLGMKFVPVPIVGGPTNGQPVLFSVWETRVRDYAAFAAETKRLWHKPNFSQTEDDPAVNILWDDAKAFCAWLSQKEGRTYRLPSDHEWSCAVGIGEREDPALRPSEKHGKIRDVYAWGTTWPPPEGAAHLGGHGTSPVGLHQANPFGLYDLSGNALQWCEDWYDEQQQRHVLRGAAWDGDRFQLFASHRGAGVTDTPNGSYGFRVVLVPAGK